MLRVLGINLGILAGLLVVLELLFGTWFSDVHALHQFTKPRDLRIERPNPLSETPPVIVYTRDVNGFRGLTGPVSEIDLLTVGGSTTDQRFLDDNATFQAVLRAMFAEGGRMVSVANAGIDGQTTFGHLENFPSWFSLVDGLHPRYVLFYVGINDALIVAEKGAYDVIEASSPRLRAQLYIREKSAFYQIYLIAKRAFFTPHVAHRFDKINFATGDGLVRRGRLSEDALKSPDVSSALTALETRIAALAARAKSLGAEPVFVTQRSTAWTRAGGDLFGVADVAPGFHRGLVARFGALSGIDIYRIERAVADAVLRGCRTSGGHCFDLMAEVDFDLDVDFYDEIHTTADGSARIARFLYQKLSGLSDF